MKKQFVGFLSILFLFWSPNAFAEKRPLSFEDFIQIKRISDPQLSPKGDLIAFVVTEMDLEKNASNSDIWIIPTKGGEPWRLTSSPRTDSHPRWSPDGGKIAFISTRGESPQIWMIDTRGGEAYRVSTLSTGASGVIWSPTGQQMAFSSSVFPDCPDDDCNKARMENKEKNPVKAKIFDELLYRHWNAWRDGMRSHVFVIPAEGGEAQDVTPGDYDTPPISLGGRQDYVFSPNGRSCKNHLQQSQ
jgi:dipeptidyl aminopeptidase/acylaminoacyl peptidase